MLSKGVTQDESRDLLSALKHKRDDVMLDSIKS